MNSFGRTLLVTGSESLLTAHAIDGRHRATLVEEPDAGVNRIYGAELTDSVLSEVMGGSLFSNRVVAITDGAGSTPPDVVDTLVTLAENPGDELYLVPPHEGGNRGRGLIGKLRKIKIETIAVAAPKSWDLPKFCVEKVQFRKVKLPQDVAGAFMTAVGSDLRVLTSATAQLASNINDELVDETLVRKYFVGRTGVTSSMVPDATLVGDASLALEHLRWAPGSGVVPVLIISATTGALRGMGKHLEVRGSGANLA